MVKIRPIPFLVMLLCIEMPYAVAADASNTGESIIEGDRMEIYLDRSLKSTGDASLKQGEQTIYGDTIQYDVQNSEIHAIGNAKVIFKDTSAWGPELKMKLGESIGKMPDANFKMRNEVKRLSNGQFNRSIATQNIEDADPAKQTTQVINSRGDAKNLLFESESKKRFLNARYTTCSADSDDWYIKAKDLLIDDYSKTATAKHASVEFKGVPLLYTPWMHFSYVNQRKSGILAPSIGTTSRSGFEVLVPYYWNISPDKDATFATRVLSKRGIQYQGEFRYLDDKYSGKDSIEYLPGDDLTQKDRYYAKLAHQHNFGSGWSGNFSFERVSDNQYFADLSTRIASTSRVNLPQQANLNYAGDVVKFNATVQKYQTLNANAFPYEKMPQFNLSANDDIAWFNANLIGQWTKFDRNASAIKTISTVSGGSLTTAVTGDRLVAYPSISLPMQRPYGYVTPKLGVRYTSYNLDKPGYVLDGTPGTYQSTSVTLPVFSVDSGLFFDRKMRVVKREYQQTLEPRLYYVNIPYQNQSMFPIFDTADADLNLGTLFQENQYVGNDRVNNANQLSMAVTSRMIDANTGEQRLAATLGQRFYFENQRVGLPGEKLRTGSTSDIVTAATAKLINKWNVDAAWQFNTDTSETIRANIGTRYSPEPGKALNLAYRYTKERLEQINISSQWPLAPRWFGLGRWNYSFKENQPIEGLAGFEYDGGCWQARSVIQRITTATADANYSIFFQLELGSLTSIGDNPLSLLRRSIPGYTSSDFIQNTPQTSLTQE